MSLWFWFSETLTSQPQDEEFLFRADTESFRSFMRQLNWEFETLYSSFSFPTSSSNEFFHYYSLVWQKCSKVSNTCSPRNSPLIGMISGTSGDILPISIPTMDGDCSHEIKRCFLLGRKAMTYLDSVLKSRDIILPARRPAGWKVLDRNQHCSLEAEIFPSLRNLSFCLYVPPTEELNPSLWSRIISFT